MVGLLFKNWQSKWGGPRFKIGVDLEGRGPRRGWGAGSLGAFECFAGPGDLKELDEGPTSDPISSDPYPPASLFLQPLPGWQQ